MRKTAKDSYPRAAERSPAAWTSSAMATLDIAAHGARSAGFRVDLPTGFDGIVGRDQAATLRIDDSLVSRQHARLLHDGRGVVLTDLGSTNGTLINGKTISRPSLLSDGDVVSFGGVSAAFHGSGSDRSRRADASADLRGAEGTTTGSRREKTMISKSPYDSIVNGGDSRSVKLAQQYINAKNNAGAIQILSPYLRANPRDIEAMHLLGIAYYESRHFADAESVYSTIWQLEPNDFRATFGMGISLQRLGRFDEAAQWLAATLRINPGFERAARRLRQLETARDPQPVKVEREGKEPARSTALSALQRGQPNERNDEGPARRPSLPRESSLVLPDTDEEFVDFERRARRKAIIEARANNVAQIAGIPWWGKLLIVIMVIFLLGGAVSTYSRSSEIWRDIENTKQEHCKSARSHGVELPGC
jgi:pSer/pThr/pTyr-binding forkhead associated (FHA) protein